MVSIIIFSPFSGRRRLIHRKRRLLLIPTDSPLHFNLENKKCQSLCTIRSFISHVFMCTFTVLSNVFGMPADIPSPLKDVFFSCPLGPGEKSPGSCPNGQAPDGIPMLADAGETLETPPSWRLPVELLVGPSPGNSHSARLWRSRSWKPGADPGGSRQAQLSVY